MKTGKITLLLVDDHAIVREGYRALLMKQSEFAVIAEAENADQAYRQYQLHTPDITLMDISLPGKSGIETITRIRQRDREAKILVFTMHQNSRFAMQALKAGALGYVTKSSPPEVLLNALHDTYAGRRILSPDIAQALALENTGYEATILDRLTSREFEILRLLSEGRSKQDIADTLSISAKTVSNLHSLIKSKIGVESDVELVFWALKMEIIQQPKPAR